MSNLFKMVKLLIDHPVQYWRKHPAQHKIIGSAVRILTASCPKHNNKARWENILRADSLCPLCLHDEIFYLTKKLEEADNYYSGNLEAQNELDEIKKVIKEILDWDYLCLDPSSESTSWFLEMRDKLGRLLGGR